MTPDLIAALTLLGSIACGMVIGYLAGRTVTRIVNHADQRAITAMWSEVGEE